MAVDVLDAAAEVEALGGCNDVRVGYMEVVARVHHDAAAAGGGTPVVKAVGDSIVRCTGLRRGRVDGSPPPSPQPGDADADVVHHVNLALGTDASDDRLYETLGETLLDWLWGGFNTALLATGQRGTGKSRSLFGSGGGLVPGITDPGPHDLPTLRAACRNHGLVARLVCALFARVEGAASAYRVGLSYYEMRHNTVVDLLSPHDPTAQPRRRSPSRSGRRGRSGSAEAGRDDGPVATVQVATAAEALDLLLRVGRARSVNFECGPEDGAADAAATQGSPQGDVAGAVAQEEGKEAPDADAGPRMAVRTVPTPTPLPRAHSFVRLELHNLDLRLVSCLHIVDLVGVASSSTLQSLEGVEHRSRARFERVVTRQHTAMAKLLADLASSSQRGDVSRRQVAHAHSTKLAQQLGPLLANNCKAFMLATLSPHAADGAITDATLAMCECAMRIKNACVRVRGLPKRQRLVPYSQGLVHSLLPLQKSPSTARTAVTPVANGHLEAAPTPLSEPATPDRVGATADTGATPEAPADATVGGDPDATTKRPAAATGEAGAAVRGSSNGAQARTPSSAGQEPTRGPAPATLDAAAVNTGSPSPSRVAAVSPPRQPATAHHSNEQHGTSPSPPPPPRQQHAQGLPAAAASPMLGMPGFSHRPVVSQQAVASHAAYQEFVRGGRSPPTRRPISRVDESPPAGVTTNGQPVGDGYTSSMSQHHHQQHRAAEAERLRARGKAPTEGYARRHGGGGSATLEVDPVNGRVPGEGASAERHSSVDALHDDDAAAAASDGSGEPPPSAVLDARADDVAERVAALHAKSARFLQLWDAGLRTSRLLPEDERVPPTQPAPAAHNSLHHPPAWDRLQTAGASARCFACWAVLRVVRALLMCGCGGGGVQVRTLRGCRAWRALRVQPRRRQAAHLSAGRWSHRRRSCGMR